MTENVELTEQNIEKTDEQTANEKEKLLIRAEFDSKNACRFLTLSSSLTLVFSMLFVSELHYIVFVILCFAALVLASFGLYIGNGTLRARFHVTNKYVYSKTLFGSIKMMPVEKVEMVSVSYFNSITIGTQKNKVTLFFIQNRDEVASRLREIIK